MMASGVDGGDMLRAAGAQEFRLETVAMLTRKAAQVSTDRQR